jgi:hypothetical protein
MVACLLPYTLPHVLCRNTAFVYISAEYLGGALAALLALLLYGPGPEHGAGHEGEALAGMVAAPSPRGASSAAKSERMGLVALTAHGSSSAAQPPAWEARY